MIICDVHEPDNIVLLIQQAVPAPTQALNEQVWGDYKWEGVFGHIHHWERKTWNELCAGLESIEDQLRREQQAHPDATLGLIIEGVATAHRTDIVKGTQVWTAPKS